MSINRFAARIDANKKEIVKGLRQAGYYVYDLRRPTDLLVWTGGLWIPLEIKTEKGTPTAAQRKFFDEAKGPVVIATSLTEAIEKLEALGRTS